MAKIPELKKIDFDKGWFDAGGKRYYIQSNLSFERYKKYIEFQHKLAFGATVEQHITFVNYVVSVLSGPLTGMALHKVLENAMNVQNAYKNFVADKMDPVFEFLTLFINRADEDVTVWDERIAKEKVNDWSTAGYDPHDFFLLLGMLSPTLREKYLPSLNAEEADEEE